jgi:iron complex transport system substrate-binding protein
MLEDLDEIARTVIDTGFHMHKDLGPGLLESAYELILFEKLISLGLRVDRQVAINIAYSGIKVENAFKVDLLVEQRLVVELKATEGFAPVHAKQVLTYLKLMNLPLGLLINFGAATFKQGVRRLANNHTDLAS